MVAPLYKTYGQLHVAKMFNREHVSHELKGWEFSSDVGRYSSKGVQYINCARSARKIFDHALF